MCKSLYVYPLVKLKDSDKRKLLFEAGMRIKDREELNDLVKLSKDFDMWNRVHLTKLSSMQMILQKNDVDKLIKFVSVPCGKCADCLKDNSRGWAFRILQEAKQWKDNYFVTLTYDDDHVPSNMQLVKDEISKFNKALKVYLKRNNCNSDFRFYGVGEYGSHTFRPHYHVIYFNLDLPDLKFEYSDDNGYLFFSSELLSKVWNKGFVLIGSVDVGSACYVARYCDKKKLLSVQERKDLKDKNIQAEFSVMSRRPGIGSNFIEEAVDSINNECYNFRYKGSSYNLSKYYTGKIKDLVSPDVLEKYENVKIQNSVMKYASDICLNDSVGDVESYYQFLDNNRLANKKDRNF